MSSLYNTGYILFIILQLSDTIVTFGTSVTNIAYRSFYGCNVFNRY
ncbi:MAG: hypothetical protein LBV41_11260 [Cytophagaceae bacterium]|nr:hypothetical protein [Cytophagaceae bacterium]